MNKNSLKTIEFLNPEQKDIIKRMIFGPYEPEWKNSKGIIMNSDREIGVLLNIKTSTISGHTSHIVEKHFERVINEINTPRNYD
jgi:hypothetical protein